MLADALDGSLLRIAHPVFDLGEGLLDGIEVRRVRRKVPEPCASGADHLSNGGGLVGAEVIHDHDVAGPEDRYELLFDPGPEADAVDGPVKDARSGKPIIAQGSEEGQGAPMAVRGKSSQTQALLSPSPQRGHVGFDPGFVDKNQPFRVDPSLPNAPALPAARNVGTGLLKGEQRFF